MSTPTVPPEGGSLAARPLMGLAPAADLPPMNVPNLDDMPIEDVIRFHTNISRLSSFCTHREIAFKARLAGRVADAVEHEKSMEYYYRDLPDNWRW